MTKKAGILVLILVLLLPVFIWGLSRLRQRDSRHETAPNEDASGQLQTAYKEEAKTVEREELTMQSHFYSFTLNDIDGNPVPLSRYRGQVVLVVNVASQCGFTRQYEGLQQLYENYKDRGFFVLGFPANNFSGQEPGTDAEIKNFCTAKFKVSFPMFSKISVKGNDIHPLYQYLTSPRENGEFGRPIAWNFNKFLIDRNGKTIGYYESRVEPLDAQITEAIEKALKNP